MSRALLALAVVLTAAGCGQQAVSTPPPSPGPAPAACGWYTPTGGIEQVVVTATGPACADPPVVDWLVAMTRRQWIATTLYPAATASIVYAQLSRAGAVVRVWTWGHSTATLTVAGTVARQLKAAGWQAQPPGLP